MNDNLPVACLCCLTRGKIRHYHNQVDLDRSNAKLKKIEKRHEK